MRYIPSIFDVFDDDFMDRPVPPRMNDVMKTDVHQKDGNYILEVELPGYKKEELKIDLKQGYLTIQANHDVTNETEDDNKKVIRRERRFGSCSRRFYVGEVDTKDVKAKFENGLLTVTFPDGSQPKVEEKKDIAID